MMKKVLYGIFAITALAATSVSAAPVQVGEAAGSAATSVSAGETPPRPFFTPPTPPDPGRSLFAAFFF